MACRGKFSAVYYFVPPLRRLCSARLPSRRSQASAAKFTTRMRQSIVGKEPLGKRKAGSSGVGGTVPK